MKTKKHCVFIKTDLRYDGRVCAIIKTLALAFPADTVYVYALTNENINISFPANVQYNRYRSLFAQLSKKHIFQIFKTMEFALFSFFKLLWLNPKTVQVHHEPVILGPLLYKLLKKNCFFLYDDKELYVPKNKNIPPSLFFIEKIMIRRANIVVYTNEYRRKAIYYIFKPKNKHIIIENFAFEPQYNTLDKSTISLLDTVKGKKILLHQGVLSKNRGLEKILNILDYLPHEWIMAFIGVSAEEFRDFVEKIPEKHECAVKYFGFIPYPQLNTFWKKVDAGTIFYDDSTFNNKYAAPNRLYSAANNGVPIIVNTENVTLSSFIERYVSGICFPPKENISVFFQNFDFYNDCAKRHIGTFEYSEGYIPQLLHVYKNLES